MMTDEQKAEAAAKQARMADTFSVILSTFAGAWMAHGSFGAGAFSLTSPSMAAVAGAVGSLMVVLAMRSLEREGRRPETRDAQTPPEPRPPGFEWAAWAMIAIPILAGFLIWQREPLRFPPRLVFQIGAASIVLTALLGYLDIRRLMHRNPDCNPEPYNANPSSGRFAGLLGFWILAYPLHFVSRRKWGGRNLIGPALAALVIFMVPSVLALYAPPELPAGDDPTVMTTLRGMFDGDPEVRARFGSVLIVRPIEVSFDREAQRRVMKAFASSREGEIPFLYELTWQDRSAQQFQVRVLDERP